MNVRSLLIAFLAATFSGSVNAEQIVENFSTRVYLDSANSTAVWNQELGVLHPTLEVTNYNGVAPALPMNVGDGSDGAFEPGRYEEFGTVVGNRIYIDTDDVRRRELKVTRFLLEENWVLEPTGSRPLVIRSLSDVIVRGEIWCHGQDAVGQTGGEGRCGGARGGDGGGTGLAGQDGEDSIAPVTGGMGGAAGAAARGGGGGGSWSLVSPPANGAGFAGGVGLPEEPGERGISSSDPTFSVLVSDAPGGGAGGGGGGGGTVGVSGGGGGGGGVVFIEAVGDLVIGSTLDPLIGFIFANGGDGSDPTGDGGAGAGGGGGGVYVAIGGTIRIHSNSGVAGSQAVGGRNNAPVVGAAGGIGRSFFSSIGYSSAGFYDPSEELPVGPGTVEFVGPTAQTITSTSFDLGNTLGQIIALTPSPASGDFTLEAAGSSDNFVSDDTGFSTDLTRLHEKRYLKFRVIIQNSSPSTPVRMTSLTITYAAGTREKFEFKAAGCGRVDGNSGSPWSLALLLIPFLVLGLLRYKKGSETF